MTRPTARARAPRRPQRSVRHLAAVPSALRDLEHHRRGRDRAVAPPALHATPPHALRRRPVRRASLAATPESCNDLYQRLGVLGRLRRSPPQMPVAELNRLAAAARAFFSADPSGGAGASNLGDGREQRASGIEVSLRVTVGAGSRAAFVDSAIPSRRRARRRRGRPRLASSVGPIVANRSTGAPSGFRRAITWRTLRRGERARKSSGPELPTTIEQLHDLRSGRDLRRKIRHRRVGNFCKSAFAVSPR